MIASTMLSCFVDATPGIPPALDYYFFFYEHATPRVLHSFPTRRSSDLAGAARGGRHDPPQALPAQRHARLRAPARSEEHTSELQSPYELVCRLLLEKKNSPASTTETTVTS